MDFFSQQDQARRSTKVLVALFLAAVFLLIVITNVLVAVTLFLFDEKLAGNYQAYQQAAQTLSYQATANITDYFSWQQFGKITLVVSGVISSAMLFKWAQVSGGGKRVAEQLGGKRIDPNTDDSQQRLVLNVVEEMALASGMPVPAVYLLADEVGINAFAAGSTPADAVIGVTSGCIEQFNREQLQGIIAHEFSHILNGDMRLNIRLIAILHGIVFIGLIGHMILRATSGYGHRRGFSTRRRSDGRLAILGFALLAIGWLGQFFGNWIKAAVSRQREFLADASAVQFTRNPQGIAQALKIIGGYQASTTVDAPNAEEVSHLFFGSAINHFNSLFATHPPLDQRIERIEPHWDGKFIARKINHGEPAADNQTKVDRDALFTTALATAGAVVGAAASGTGFAEDGAANSTGISPALTRQAREPFAAIAIVYGLLLSEEEAIQEKQLDYIKLTGISGLAMQTLQLRPDIAKLGKSQRLPLIELALPALKCMSEPQYKAFIKSLLLLIRADKRFELFEWCLYQLVRHYLDPEFGKSKPGRPIYKQAAEVADEYRLVLSMLVHFGHTDSTESDKAFGRGANTAGTYAISLLDKEQCTLDSFVSAVNKLGNCFPLLKPRLLKGLAEAARHDGIVSDTERELITAIAAVMDTPTPRILDKPVA